VKLKTGKELKIAWKSKIHRHKRSAKQCRDSLLSRFGFQSILISLILPVVLLRAQTGVIIDVRDESPSDLNAVYEVVSSAFGQSAEAEPVKELREAGDSVF